MAGDRAKIGKILDRRRIGRQHCQSAADRHTPYCLLRLQYRQGARQPARIQLRISLVIRLVTFFGDCSHLF